MVTGWFGEGTDGVACLTKRPYRYGLPLSSKPGEWCCGKTCWAFTREPTLGRSIFTDPYLGYGEAIEFANADATILHPATVEPVYEMGIPSRFATSRATRTTA